jgi:tetratricopeptide (TPR) repeat protein
VAAWLGALVAVGVAGVFGALGMAGAVLVIVASGTLVALADGGVGHAATGGAPVKSSRRRAARAKAQQRGGPVAARARLDRAALVAGAVVGAVALVLSGLDLAASRACAEARGLLEESRALGGTVRQGALGAAGQAALRASALMPTHDMPFRLRGEALMALAAGSRDAPALLDQAESALRRAVALLPLRALNHERLASLLAARAVSGDRAAIPRAEAAFARAVELAPVDVFPLVDWARAELALSRPQAAIEPARRAVALYPDEALARSMLAAAQLSLGQREAARATLERAMAGEWHGNLREREMTQRLLESLR